MGRRERVGDDPPSEDPDFVAKHLAGYSRSDLASVSIVWVVVVGSGWDARQTVRGEFWEAFGEWWSDYAFGLFRMLVRH